MRAWLAYARNPLLFRFHSDRRTVMKIKKALLISTLLTASSLAMAQGAGGSGGGGGGPAGNDPSTTGGANTSTREGGDATSSGAMSHSKPKKHSSKSKAMKPATDTTNMPGANASSDTKGQ
jgi:hypothetical protein